MCDNVKRVVFTTLIVLAVFGMIGGVVSSFNAVTGEDKTRNYNRATSEQLQTEVEETSKIETKTEIKHETIAYETEYVKDDSIEYGKAVTKAAGAYGEMTYTYEVTYENDKEVSRKLLSKELTRQPISQVVAEGTKVVWRCVDVTSYDKNPYNDNKCTSSTGEVRYVSDSQSRSLDLTYTPGKSGHWYYNSR